MQSRDAVHEASIPAGGVGKTAIFVRLKRWLGRRVPQPVPSLCHARRPPFSGKSRPRLSSKLPAHCHVLSPGAAARLTRPTLQASPEKYADGTAHGASKSTGSPRPPFGGGNPLPPALPDRARRVRDWDPRALRIRAVFEPAPTRGRAQRAVFRDHVPACALR